MDRIIQDIFSGYEIRKTKKQKTAFLDYAVKKAEEEGYTVTIERGPLGSRNLVVGDPDSAKVIYTAHYDTCPRLPFPNFLTPKNIGVYLLYNLVVILAFFAVSLAVGVSVGLIGALLKLDPAVGSSMAMLAYWAMILLMLFGPANKHTANDNTSGITVLFGIMKALPKEQKGKAAFVFFDHEEIGLVGSSAFSGRHRKVRDNTLLVNFDCVSDGSDILVLAKKAAEPYTLQLSTAFASSKDIRVDVTNKAFYPSDQVKFKKGVGVAAFRRTKSGLLYISRIHTNKDTVYRRENIAFLIDGSVRLAGLL